MIIFLEGLSYLPVATVCRYSCHEIGQNTEKENEGMDLMMNKAGVWVDGKHTDDAWHWRGYRFVVIQYHSCDREALKGKSCDVKGRSNISKGYHNVMTHS